MKMKQVCQLTGLTERTIRFYVEKELCAPETRWMDQRKYYDFSKENVEELRQAAELRKAYFSIQAIQTMRSSPERIPEILKTYRQGLAADEAHKRKLLDVMEQMDVEQIGSVAALANKLERVSAALSLPQADLAPNLAGWTDFHGKKRKRRTRSTSGAGSGMKNRKICGLWNRGPKRSGQSGFLDCAGGFYLSFTF
mgnify:CR=1 FL=1